MATLRKIIHIDMDAFYASVEQRDQPQYRGKPLVVGGSASQRGAVAAASYEARQYGIHSAMPTRLACKHCPHLIVVPPRFEVYRAVSMHIRSIFSSYTDRVEPLALDEAYLDVTENKQGLPSAIWIAQAIKEQIYQETGLTASAGVSINKFLAKIASGMDKPNGLFLISPAAAEGFIKQLPIERFYGIGEVTAAKMHRLGIHSGADLKGWSAAGLVRQFGKVGQFYYKIARAEDDRPVQPNRIRKSIGAETSFARDLADRASIRAAIEEIAQTLQQRLDEQQTSGRTLTLKVKCSDYQQVTRSRTTLTPIGELAMIVSMAEELLELTAIDDRQVRLLGLSLSNLEGEQSDATCVQLTLQL